MEGVDPRRSVLQPVRGCNAYRPATWVGLRAVLRLEAAHEGDADFKSSAMMIDGCEKAKSGSCDGDLVPVRRLL